jgi:tRNA1(Val) A37 N6-methylase TrmN6
VSTAGLTLDRFLDGRVIAAQPLSGFRAGHDTVLLAAAVPAEAGSVALELGSGAGIASLCLAARVPEIRITGIEIDPELVRLANENAARNGVADRVSFKTADASESFTQAIGIDHVFFNPPFHPDSGHVSPLAARDRATRDTRDAVGEWTGRALSLVRDGGTVTAIVRADRIQEILDAAKGYGGVVFPLLPRAGVKPKRAIVRIVKTKRVLLEPKHSPLPSPLEGEEPAPDLIGGAKRRKGGDAQGRAHFHTAAGLVLHERDGRNTQAAEAVLRHASPLNLAP